MSLALVKMIFLSLGLVNAASQLTSNPRGLLTLEDVLNSVDRSYPDILRAQAEAESQKGKAKASLSAFDPKLSVEWGQHRDGYPENESFGAKLGAQIPGTGITADIGWDRSTGSFPLYEGDRETGNQGRLKSALSIPLIRDLIIDSARAKSKIENLRVNEKEESARVVKIETYVAAATTYWHWLAQVEIQKTVKNLLALAQQREDILAKRVQRGDAPGIDLVDNQRVLLQRKSQLLKAQQETLNSSLALSLFLRDEAEHPVSPADETAPAWLSEKRLQLPPDIGDFEDVIERYPGIRKIKLELNQLEVSQKLNRQSVFPRLDLRLENARYEGEIPTFRKDQNEFFVGLEFSVPLFNFSAHGNLYATDMDLRAQSMELKLKEQRLKVELLQLLSEVRTARSIFEANFSEYKASDQVAKAERKKFQRGDSNIFMVNAREVDAALAQIKAVGALVDYHLKDLKVRLLKNNWIRTY